MAGVTAAAVSRRLADRFTRSTALPSSVRGYRPMGAGFAVSAGSGGGAFVEHVPNRFMGGDERRARIQDRVEQYAEHLRQWYTVKIETDEAGSPYVSVLAHKPKEG